MAPPSRLAGSKQAGPMPGQRAQRVRHQQTNKADDAGHGGCRADAERGAGHDCKPRATGIDAEADGGVLAQRQGIERSADEQQQANADEHQGRR